MEKKCILVESCDNVIVATEPLSDGDRASYPTGSVTVVGSVPVYHKLARVDIKCGENVVKYGQIIGRANRDIVQGEHVHVHNVTSIRQEF